MNTTTSSLKRSATAARRLGAVLLMLLVGSVAARADCLEGGLGLEPAAITSVIPHPSEPDTLFVTQSYVSEYSQALLKSCDGGETWSATALTSDFYDVLSLAVDPTDSETVYAQTNLGPVVSQDGGITWTETDMPSGDLVFASDGTLYAAGWPIIHRRLPGQNSFTELAQVPGIYAALRIHPTDLNRLHVGTHYSVDGGGSWQKVLPDSTFDVSYSPADAMRLIAIAPLRLSFDGGVNWQAPVYQEFSSFNDDTEFTAVLLDGDDPDTIWATLDSCGLLRSESNGTLWNLRANGMTGESEYCIFSNDYPLVTQFYSSPLDGDRYYAVTSDGLFVTADDGQNWTSANGVAAPQPPAPPPPNPYSGNADLKFELFKVPKKFTPPTTLKFSGRITNYGPDTARDVSFSIAADVVSVSRGTCGQHGCEIVDLAPGATVELSFERDLLGGGGGTRCNGDKLQVSGRVTSEINDPNPANNEATGEVTRKNSGAIISGCPGEGLLRPEGEESGGGSTGLLFLAGLLATRRFSRKQR